MSVDMVKPKTMVSEASGEPKAGKSGKEVAAARVDERFLAEAEDPKVAKISRRRRRD
jgi:hypothetical protein